MHFDIVACLANDFEVAYDRVLRHLAAHERDFSHLTRVALDAFDRVDDKRWVIAQTLGVPAHRGIASASTAARNSSRKALGAWHVDRNAKTLQQLVPNGADIEQRGVCGRIGKDVQVTALDIRSMCDGAKNARIPRVVRGHHTRDNVAMSLQGERRSNRCSKINAA